MIKKYSKLFALTFLAFFISMVTTNAKQVTADELGKEILKTNPDAGHVYVIGSYAFTSEYALKYDIKDIMLASADSISVTVGDGETKANLETLSETMTIYEIVRKTDTDWQYTKNVVGNGTAFNNNGKVNIKYIDYEYLKEDVPVDTDTKLTEAFEGYQNTSLFTFNTDDIAKGNITANVENLKESIVVGMSSGIIDALRTFLTNNPQVESIEFKSDIKGVEPFTFTSETTDREIEDWAKVNLIKVFGENADGITADLIDKKFTAKLNLGESATENYMAKKNNSKSVEYTVSFTGTKSQIDTDNIVQTASQNEKLNKEIFDASFDKTNHTVSVTVKDVEKNIAVGMGSGVVEILKSLLENENVKSIEFTANNADPFIFNSSTTTKNITDWLEANMPKIFGEEAEGVTYDLIDQTFNFKINLRSYAEKETENPEEYTVTFTGNKKTVDVDTIVKNASTSNTLNSDMFEATYSEGTVTVNVKDLNATISEGMGSGVLATLEKILEDNSSIKSIEFTADNADPFIFSSGTTIEEINNWLEANILKIFGESADGITADLIGKTFKATVNLKYYAEKTDGNKEEYTFTFTGTPKTVTGEELLKGGFIVDESGTGSSVINPKLYDVKLNEKKITVTAQDIDTEIKIGMNSGVLVAMDELFKSPEVKSVTFSYEGLEFTYNPFTTTTDIENWITENAEKIAELGFIKEKLTNADIIGKTINVTINLKSSATFANSKNSETYEVTFEAVKHTLTFIDAENKTEEVEDGKMLKEENIPTANKEGYKFDYWYDETADETTKFDFNAPVKKDVKLKAKWIEIIKQLPEATTFTSKINSQNKYNVTVSGNDVSVKYPKANKAKPLNGLNGELMGAGIKTAILDFLTTSTTGVASIDICDESQETCANLVREDADIDTNFIKNNAIQYTMCSAFPSSCSLDEQTKAKYEEEYGKVEALLDKFGVVINKLLEGTGKTIDNVTNNDLNNKKFKVKVNLAEGKEFAENISNIYNVTFAEGD